MDLDLLEQRVAELGEPDYRARQAWDWAARGISGYDGMTNLPLALRETLAADVPFSTVTPEDEQCARDGTVKTFFRTADGHPVEAVLMRYRDGRRSVCVSSQSGCPLTCTSARRAGWRSAGTSRRGRSSIRCSTSGGASP